jgi:hypothetical protein
MYELETSSYIIYRDQWIKGSSNKKVCGGRRAWEEGGDKRKEKQRQDLII